MTLKTARSYLHSSGQKTGTWRTDGRTYRRTFSPRAMRTRCKKKEREVHQQSLRPSDIPVGRPNKLIRFETIGNSKTTALAWKSRLNVADFSPSVKYNVRQKTAPFVFTALHGMQTRSSDENSVCLSVCPSVRPSVKRMHCDKTEEKSVQIVLYQTTEHLAQFSEKKNGWYGRPLLPEILGQPTAAKSSILNRYSLVAPQP